MRLIADQLQPGTSVDNGSTLLFYVLQLNLNSFSQYDFLFLSETFFYNVLTFIALKY